MRVVFFILSFCWLAAPVAAAEDAAEIVRRVDAQAASDTGVSKLTMHIYPDRHDETNRRDFKVIAYNRGDEQSTMAFLAPRTIKGLRILSLDGDQWVYFPSTGRVRKIAGKSKKKSVQGVGGDFSYEDLGGGALASKYTFTIAQTTPERWILEGLPKASDSAYVKIRLEVDRDTYHVPKISYFTAEDGHAKDLLQQDIKTFSGREVPTRLTMINLAAESKTVVLVHDAQYDIPIDAWRFNPTRFYR